MASPVSLVSLGPLVSRDSLETPAFLAFLVYRVSLAFLVPLVHLAPLVGPTSRCPRQVRAQGTNCHPLRRSRC